MCDGWDIYRGQKEMLKTKEGNNWRKNAPETCTDGKKRKGKARGLLKEILCEGHSEAKIWLVITENKRKRRKEHEKEHEGQ